MKLKAAAGGILAAVLASTTGFCAFNLFPEEPPTETAPAPDPVSEPIPLLPPTDTRKAGTNG